MTEPTGRPASRYGRAPMPAATRRRATLALGGVVVALSVGAAALAYQRFEDVDVEGGVSTFEVVDDNTVEITISVTRKDPSVPAVCIVRARSRDGAETGRREVLIPGSKNKTVQVTTMVKSATRPSVGDLYGCGIDVPGYLVES